MRSVLEVRFHILTEHSKTHIQTEFSKSRVEIAQGLMTGSDMITGMIRQRPSQVSVNKMPFCGSIMSKPRAWWYSNPPKNRNDSLLLLSSSVLVIQQSVLSVKHTTGFL